MTVTTKGDPEALVQSPKHPQPYVPNQLLVKFRPEAAANLKQSPGQYPEQRQKRTAIFKSLEWLNLRFAHRSENRLKFGFQLSRICPECINLQTFLRLTNR